MSIGKRSSSSSTLSRHSIPPSPTPASIVQPSATGDAPPHVTAAEHIWLTNGSPLRWSCPEITPQAGGWVRPLSAIPNLHPARRTLDGPRWRPGRRRSWSPLSNRSVVGDADHTSFPQMDFDSPESAGVGWHVSMQAVEDAHHRGGPRGGLRKIESAGHRVWVVAQVDLDPGRLAVDLDLRRDRDSVWNARERVVHARAPAAAARQRADRGGHPRLAVVEPCVRVRRQACPSRLRHRARPDGARRPGRCRAARGSHLATGRARANASRTSG